MDALVPRLREYRPRTLTIDDPEDVVRAAIGGNIELHGFGLNWEFETPIRRAFIAPTEPDDVERPIGTGAVASA